MTGPFDLAKYEARLKELCESYLQHQFYVDDNLNLPEDFAALIARIKQQDEEIKNMRAAAYTIQGPEMTRR